MEAITSLSAWSSEKKTGVGGVTLTKDQLRRLVRQFPPHDHDGRHCQGPLSDDDKRRLDEFRDVRYRDALGQGTLLQLQHKAACRQCGDMLAAGDLAVKTERAASDDQQEQLWHVDCFKCAKCQETPFNLVHFCVAGKLYCGRHHAETVRPRCFACDELIFADECTEAEGEFWHIEHFVCSQCTRSLGGRKFIVRDGRPTCIDCFHTLLADYCDTCGRIVAVDQRHVTTGSRTWHATPTCFRCARCRRSLLGRPVFVAPSQTDARLFCSDECRQDRKHVTGNSSGDVSRTRRSRSVGRIHRRSLGDVDSFEKQTNRHSVVGLLEEPTIRMRETTL